MSILNNVLQLYQMHHGAVIFIPFVSSLFLLLLIGFYHFVYPKKWMSPFLLVLFISIPPVLNIFRPGTYQAGDLSLHAEYLRAFYQNLSYGIFIPRWAADFCAGNGCPIFEFSYVLPYYIGSLFHLFGFSYLDSMKFVLAFSFIGSGIAMYLFMKDELGKTGGIIAAIFYLFSPYHLIDLHFRGSVGEVLSYVFIPLVFLFSRRLIIQTKLRYFLMTAFSAILLLYSHSVTAIFSIPLLIIYDILLIKKNYKKLFSKQFFILVLSYLTAILLSAYYWMPAFLESRYTWIARYPHTNFFEPIQNYIFSPVGYGLLFQGHQGENRLVLGYPHIIVLLVAIYLLFWQKKFFDTFQRLLLFCFFIVFIIYFLLMQTFAKTFWDHFSFLNFVLMVWRLLVPIGFILSVISGIVVSKIKNMKIITIICFLTIAITMLNWGNRDMVPYNPNGYFTHWDEYTEYTEVGNPFYDLLYKERVSHVVQMASLKYRAKYPLETISGDMQYDEINRTPLVHEYIVDVKKSAVIKENTFYFPGWEVFANNKKLSINYRYVSDAGKITFVLPKGLYDLNIVFTDTPIRAFSKWISYLTLIVLIIGIFSIRMWTHPKKMKKTK